MHDAHLGRLTQGLLELGAADVHFEGTGDCLLQPLDLIGTVGRREGVLKLFARGLASQEESFNGDNLGQTTSNCVLLLEDSQTRPNTSNTPSDWSSFVESISFLTF